MSTKPKVMVDFSSLSRGRVRAPIERSFGGVPLEGNFVLAFDPDDDLCADALVAEVRDGFVYLAVKWESQRDFSGENGPVNNGGGAPSATGEVLETTPNTHVLVSADRPAILV